MALAQAMLPLWSYHPAAAGLRVHLSNGLYVNAIVRPAARQLVDPFSDAQRRSSEMNPNIHSDPSAAQSELISAADAAGRAIPPLWPLASSVAVNPFLGQTDRSLSEVAAR